MGAILDFNTWWIKIIARFALCSNIKHRAPQHLYKTKKGVTPPTIWLCTCFKHTAQNNAHDRKRGYSVLLTDEKPLSWDCFAQYSIFVTNAQGYCIQALLIQTSQKNKIYVSQIVKTYLNIMILLLLFYLVSIELVLENITKSMPYLHLRFVQNHIFIDKILHN